MNHDTICASLEVKACPHQSIFSENIRSGYEFVVTCERINSQAKELGIERPKVRNGQSVRNLNTLTYIVINTKALLKARSINRTLLTDIARGAFMVA